ncbi:ScbR family autoregulator-binding transcription factor [Streptomyces sp. NPDC090026]|uniref:ScbR family autoregulator-binding transcription factor n=1 Tax=Streptomyces sp. NPDC090026 TaxID=3365923 RepID=UPI0038108F79
MQKLMMTDSAGEFFETPSPPPAKELKQERAVRTRERVLAAAAQAFAAKGYPAVTILDVARASGMTKGAVYFHYENKDALAVAVVDMFHRRLSAVAESVEELALPPVSAVAELLIRTASAFREETVLQAGARLQVERQLISAQLPVPYQAYTDLITGWLSSREQAGPGDLVPPATLAGVLVSAFFGAQHLSWVLNDRADLLERTLAIVRTVMPMAESDLRLCPSAPRRP